MTTMMLWLVAAYLAVGVITLLVPSVRCRIDSMLPTAFSERMMATTEGGSPGSPPLNLGLRLALLRIVAYLLGVLFWPLAIKDGL
jgi:hypothetical protein